MWSVPEELQAWLQITYELEQGQYTAKRQAAERHFQAAKDSVSLMAVFVLPSFSRVKDEVCGSASLFVYLGTFCPRLIL